MDTTNGHFDKLKEWIQTTHLTPELLQTRKNPHGTTQVVTANSSVVIEDYLHKLSTHGILSAPFQLGDNNVYFVDVLMILTGFARNYKKKRPNTLTQDIMMKDSIKYFGKTIAESQLLNVPLPISQHTKFGASLYDAAKIMSDANFHRLLVHQADSNDTSADFVSIFSQSDFIYLLNEKISELGQFSSMSFVECGLVSNPVFTVKTDHTAMAALEMLAEKQVGVVVIVNSNNVFQDTLAAADFRGFRRENYMLLTKPVMDYKHYNCPRKGISCSDKITIGELISLLTTNKAHQVVFVDGEGHPTGLVSLSDVIKFIVNHTGK